MGDQPLLLDVVLQELFDVNESLKRGNGAIEHIISRVQDVATRQDWKSSYGIEFEKGDDPHKFCLSLANKKLQFSFKCSLDDGNLAGMTKVHLVPRFPEIESWLEIGEIQFNRSKVISAHVGDTEISGIIDSTGFATVACVFLIEASRLQFGPPANPPRP
jgi:hypothetical protein